MEGTPAAGSFPYKSRTYERVCAGCPETARAIKKEVKESLTSLKLMIPIEMDIIQKENYFFFLEAFLAAFLVAFLAAFFVAFFLAAI